MTPPTTAPAAPTEVQPRTLGGLAAFSVVAGSMLGIGIFIFPGEMAREVASPALFLALWAFGGIVAFAGAVACGELGAMMPRAGGDYVFQRAAFGPAIAFASGWVLFAAVFAGSVASLAMALFQYQVSALVGGDLTRPLFAHVSPAHLGAIAIIIAFTIVNDRGARISGRVQSVLTLIPAAVIVVVSVLALASARGDIPVPAVTPPATPDGWGGILAAFLLVNFAYSGWPNTIYVAGEVANPSRNLPRSMMAGVVIVGGMYLLFCAALVVSLGMRGLGALAEGHVDAGTGLAAALGWRTLSRVSLVTIAMLIATSINATVLGSARVGYAMARDGSFWRGAARLSARGVPRRALWLQAGLSCAIVTSGAFDVMVRMASIAMLVTGTLTVASLFALRRNEPARERPYRALLYPFLPALYVAVSLAVITTQAVVSIRDGDWLPPTGLAVFLAAWVWRRCLSRRGRSG